MNTRWIELPERLWSRRELLAEPSAVRAVSGVYAWYFQTIPHRRIDSSRCLQVGDLSLLYVGISPRNERSQGDIHERIFTHLAGTARGSTLRLSLGSLLRTRLKLQVVPDPKHKGKLNFGDTESRLSAWMDKNAFVTWHGHASPWTVEQSLIDKYSLPLNLDGNADHPFHPILYAARGKLRAEADRIRNI